MRSNEYQVISNQRDASGLVYSLWPMVGELLRNLKSEMLEWHRALLSAIPGDLGCVSRNVLYGYHAQPGCRVLRGVTIYFPGKLILGRNVNISSMTLMNAAGEIEIGNDTLIGPGCIIWSVNHRYRDVQVPIRSQGYDAKKVTVGSDCWIAAHAIILPGVHIGANSVVAAGAIVTKSCEPGSILGGVPAEKIGMRADAGGM